MCSYKSAGSGTARRYWRSCGFCLSSTGVGFSGIDIGDAGAVWYEEDEEREGDRDPALTAIVRDAWWATRPWWGHEIEFFCCEAPFLTTNTSDASRRENLSGL